MGSLLTTAEVAQFVARGFLRFDALIPDDLNAAAMAEMDAIIAAWGTPDRPFAPRSLDPLADVYPEPSAIGAVLRHPRVQGIIRSLVGPDAVFDHDFVHLREPGDVTTQHLHADAIIDPELAFDIQLFYFPHEVAAGEGGTAFVPGSHLRRVNENEVARYQHIVGAEQFAGPAGTILVFHHGLWHRAMPNHGDRRRYLYKIRLNPTRPQVRLWDTADLDAIQNGPEDHLFARFRTDSVAGILRNFEPWYENATYRLELTQRARLWRYLSGDPAFDVDYYLTRQEGRAALTGQSGPDS